MARARREQPDRAERERLAEMRFGDNPFMGVLGPNGEMPWPPEWGEEEKDAYMRRLRDSARSHEQKLREAGIEYEGETVVVRK